MSKLKLEEASNQLLELSQELKIQSEKNILDIQSQIDDAKQELHNRRNLGEDI